MRTKKGTHPGNSLLLCTLDPEGITGAADGTQSTALRWGMRRIKTARRIEAMRFSCISGPGECSDTLGYGKGYQAARVWESDSRPSTPPDGLVSVILSAVCVAGLSTVCSVLRGGDPKSSAPSRLRPVPPGQRQTAAHGTSSFECARVHRGV